MGTSCRVVAGIIVVVVTTVHYQIVSHYVGVFHGYLPVAAVI